MSTTTGAHIIAKALHDLGVRVIFGLVGIPVVEVAEACSALGILFIAFRNEQAAGYAAGAYGYLTGRPGVCLVVGGPGVLHAIPGVRSLSPTRRNTTTYLTRVAGRQRQRQRLPAAATGRLFRDALGRPGRIPGA